MLTITVAQDGSGDFASVSEAVLAVPYACAAEIRIGPGVYREKLVCEKQDITLIGAGMESTRIVWGDGGRLPHPDGRPTHTFRSYTAFFRGIELRVRDLTIENDAGPGAKVGQAVAAYVDCSHTLFENVRLLRQSGYAVLRPSAGEGAGEGWLPWPGPLCAPPPDGPVLPALRDRGRYRFYFWRRGRSV